MPDSITVAGISLKLRAFSETGTRYRGEEREAFDNTTLRGTDAPKRNWSGETIEYPRSTENALRVLVDAGPVACSGLVLDETVTAFVRVESAPRGPDVQGPYPDYAGINVTMALTFREV